ncbi:MAG TPA: CRTAC1 family protein [Pirellulaceae bacterium]|nr:CRTAC1 family protein [Pirellulaceae bacterium]
MSSAVAQIRRYKSGQFYRDEFRIANGGNWNGYENNVLFRGEGLDENKNPMFADVGMAVGADDIKDARGMAVADFDNDGDLDIVVNTNPGDVGKPSVPPVLLRNDLGQNRNWLAVELSGTISNHDAVGAEVVIEGRSSTGSNVKLMRHVSAGGGYASQNSDRLYFGLGDVSMQSLAVRWPSGKKHTFTELKANQLLRISEDGEIERTSLPKRDAVPERTVATHHKF